MKCSMIDVVLRSINRNFFLNPIYHIKYMEKEKEGKRKRREKKRAFVIFMYKREYIRDAGKQHLLLSSARKSGLESECSGGGRSSSINDNNERWTPSPGSRSFP
ncbi:hypothetical protein PUN28_017331 [Cardiocondyla obscurior]|uniref:Uncharacterized protein n=1 Tax=Cardiocondyla obscurior TaxID=286306 RepID=A0AAW2EQB6_9HYME